MKACMDECTFGLEPKMMAEEEDEPASRPFLFLSLLLLSFLLESSRVGPWLV